MPTKVTFPGSLNADLAARLAADLNLQDRRSSTEFRIVEDDALAGQAVKVEWSGGGVDFNPDDVLTAVDALLDESAI